MKQIKKLLLLLLVLAFSSCEKDAEVPIREYAIETNSMADITANSAKCNCIIPIGGALPVTARGVCWSTSQAPTINDSHTEDGSGIGAFTSSIAGLTVNTTYYLRAYATNSNGTYYGEEKSFQTQNGIAVVATNDISNITTTSATCGGNVTSDGGLPVTARGVCWSTSKNPTIENSHTTDGSGTGTFSSSITGLTKSTTYYVRVYATNSNGTFYGEEKSFVAIEGLFSVSSTKKVYFSKGNLQYKASTNTWRFAENQYDIIGSANSNISSSYSGWIDLFYWGTSGYNNKYPYVTSWTDTDYGNGLNNISGTNYDWGVYIGNSISNGASAKWRTLTYDEWYYLIKTRANAASKCGHATVNGVAGLVLLPDSWTLPSGCSFTSGYGSGFTTNSYSLSHWTSMENDGAVFLPAAGYRVETSVILVGTDGLYWSSTLDTDYSSIVYVFDFGVSNLYLTRGAGDSGRSVRLAQDF